MTPSLLHTLPPPTCYEQKEQQHSSWCFILRCYNETVQIQMSLRIIFRSRVIQSLFPLKTQQNNLKEISKIYLG